MKKMLVILLVAMLILGMICGYGFAEAGSPAAAPAPAISLTGMIVAALAVIFDFLIAWLIEAVVPPLKRWLDSHTTKNQQQLIWDVVTRLVEAAEQTIVGKGLGRQKMDYVKFMLMDKGYEVDTDVIEAAVKEMNDRLLFGVAQAFNLSPENDPVDADDRQDDDDPENEDDAP